MASPYATVADVEAGFREMSADEQERVEALIIEAAVIVDSFASDANEDVKKVVVCRMVRRTIDTGAAIPMGASQGTATAGPYSQSWTIGNGSFGELYLSKLDKQLLGVGNRIGSYSPIEELVVTEDD